MKSKLFIAIGFVMLLSCSDEVVKPTIWGIHYSSPEMQYRAAGIVEVFTEGRATVAIEKASVKHLRDDEYLLTYKFSSADSLNLIIIKKTSESVFNYPATDTTNTLKEVLFNGQPVTLKQSAISIQPRTAENKFTTVLTLDSEGVGAFLGTVSSVPLLK